MSGTNYRIHVDASNEMETEFDGVVSESSPKSNLLCAVTLDDVPDAPFDLTEIVSA